MPMSVRLAAYVFSCLDADNHRVKVFVGRAQWSASIPDICSFALSGGAVANCCRYSVPAGFAQIMNKCGKCALSGYVRQLVEGSWATIFELLQEFVDIGRS